MRLKHYFLILILLVVSATSYAEDADGIVARTQTNGGFWRYDFHYTTVDIDMKTPIVLSAAIFMSQAVHDKEATSPGLALMNHYTITRDADAPTSVTDYTSSLQVPTASSSSRTE